MNDLADEDGFAVLHRDVRMIQGPTPIQPLTEFPIVSPYGEIGRVGAPDAYLIDPGAGSGSDHVTRFWPAPNVQADIHRRGGSITPLYARDEAHRLRAVADADQMREAALAAFQRYVEWIAGATSRHPMKADDQRHANALVKAVRAALTGSTPA